MKKALRILLIGIIVLLSQQNVAQQAPKPALPLFQGLLSKPEVLNRWPASLSN